MPADLPPRPRYEVARLSDVPHTPTDERHVLQLPGEWKQIRHHFGVREFAVNAFIATEPGQEIVHEHVETANDGTGDPGDEELYYIAKGTAVVTLDGEEVEVDEGTFIFVGDPSVRRSVVATGAGTVVLTFGTNPGVEFLVSPFEREVSPPARWA